MSTTPALALFVPALHGGGAERMLLNLAEALVGEGTRVDLVTATAGGALADRVPAGVRRIDLRCARTVGALAPLVRYLRRARPPVLLSTLVHANILAVAAAALARVSTRVYVREATHLSHAMRAEGARGGFLLSAARAAYRRADGVVAVSCGVRADLVARVIGGRVPCLAIPNPVITPDLLSKAAQPSHHPWFTESTPVVLAAGRLTPAKDYGTLLDAFAMVTRRRPCRLLVLGEGDERARLEAQVHRLGLGSLVAMPGFAQNPYAFMRRASLFVQSSVWEGHPNTLVEALACGSRVVATDCESGPREILQDGALGVLVPPRDPRALADAIDASLSDDRPAPSAALVARYEARSVARAYRDFLQLPPGPCSADAPESVA